MRGRWQGEEFEVACRSPWSGLYPPRGGVQARRGGSGAVAPVQEKKADVGAVDGSGTVQIAITVRAGSP